ncbi:MAG: hypothetical protein PCFJNLEI_00886 [Verrucomicrobiae bacterium]|nr:hypothetical protein [Verrucomicrobiae bacterium]
MKTKSVFPHNKRIRLGIWGLGRGMSFFKTCQALNIDVVAGCDFNEHMRVNFLKHCPGAFVTANEEEFLKQDFDAVLLATFCPAHGPHAIKCLQAGKHVLSEVTAFFTLAEGVKLVEEVEKRGLVYNLAENYPFSAANMWLANRWREGLFGDLMYAEYEYVHECRSLCYTYIDGVPIQPGHSVHNWRSWFNFHYYCTHSLGPVMVITGTRPTMVEAFPGKPHLAGYLRGRADNGTMTPSLIQMNNGGIVRNLMGASSSDDHHQRIWGTRGAFVNAGGDGLRLRLGASGTSPVMRVNPRWEGLGELAAQTGHGGGDFWTLYYFAREIFTGEKGPFDIYSSCDVTIPGIQAYRSSLQGGKPLEVPDFRKKAARDRYRDDDWQQERYDVKRGVFGGAALNDNAAKFSTTMKAVVKYAPMYRAYADWRKVQSALVKPEEFLPVANRLLDNYPALVAAYRDAQAIIKDYPGTDGAQVLGEMLEVGGEKEVLAKGFLPALKREVAGLRRKFFGHEAPLLVAEASPLLPKAADIRQVKPPTAKVKFSRIEHNTQYNFHDIRPRYGASKDGLIYVRGFINVRRAGPGVLSYGSDGPIKAWVNGKVVDCQPGSTNPCAPDKFRALVKWKKGKNALLFALHTNQGRAWGITARGLLE